ncbi:MAG: hypothetical protein ACW99Q_10890 [Candidatus Kariarchaeaceae archaeon]|jgi:protein transport protein SEC61 subunit alpha
MTLEDSRGFKSINSTKKMMNRPVEDIDFTTRCWVTIGVLVVYSLLAIIPLSGANLGEGDPFAFIRIITASSQGTLAELGILPVLTAGLITYTLVGGKIFKMDTGSEKERERYNTVRILLSFLITIILASFIVYSGIYGPDLDFSTQTLIIIQLTVAGLLIILLDEIINRGWGLGSGISIFIAGSIGLRIIQGFLAPSNILEGPNNVTSARGIIFATFYWFGEEGPISAFSNLFFRYSTNPTHYLNLPSLSILSVILAVGFFILAVFLQAKDPRIASQGPFERSKNISLTPMIPLVLTATVLVLIRFISHLIWNTGGRENSRNALVYLMGQFRLDEVTGQYVPNGGIAYFITPPQSIIANLMVDPLSAIVQAIIYGTIFLGLYMIFTKLTFEIGSFNGNNPPEKEIKDRWLLIVIISVLVDLLNPLAVGFGIILLALILMSYYHLLQGLGLPELVRFDFTPLNELETRKTERRELTRSKFSLIVIFIALGLFFLRFIAFVILGREI